MSADWPKWGEMNWLRLLEGPAGGTTLPVAPTMKYLTYRGAKYFRMPDARSGRHPNSRGERTEFGGACVALVVAGLVSAGDARQERLLLHVAVKVGDPPRRVAFDALFHGDDLAEFRHDRTHYSSLTCPINPF
jgi:hypothetical protein